MFCAVEVKDITYSVLSFHYLLLLLQHYRFLRSLSHKETTVTIETNLTIQ